MSKGIYFLDLFSGIGAFHNAIKNVFFDSRCIAAVDVDKHAKETYINNFFDSKKELFFEDLNDPEVIENLSSKKITYNFLCAGFPCQPFSKAGKQMGALHKEGKLFERVIDIIKKYNENHSESKIDAILLENVAYLVNHDNKNTWYNIKSELKKLNYIFYDKEEIVISPIDFNVPQNRKRLFLIAFHEQSLINNNISFKDLQDSYLNLIKLKKKNLQINDGIKYISDVKLSKNEINNNLLETEKIDIINIWQEFLEITNLKQKIIGFPIWIDFFEIDKKILENEKESFQLWKKDFYLKNRNFYLSNKESIDQWWKKYKSKLTLKKTYRKFEWNSSGKINKISEGIIQFRHSGLRVKCPNFFPALVKTSSKPIIWDKKILKYRYIDIKEALYLQSFDFEKFKFPKNFAAEEPFKRVGNSINVKVVEKILMSHEKIINKIFRTVEKS